MNRVDRLPEGKAIDERLGAHQDRDWAEVGNAHFLTGLNRSAMDASRMMKHMAEETTSLKEVLSVEDLAGLLGISVWSVYAKVA